MFKVRVIHEHVSDPETKRQLGRIDMALHTIIQRLNRMALDFQNLEREVSEQGTVVQSAVTLLQQVAQDIRDNADNQRKINALADQLDAQAQALAQAVAANTPAEGENPTPTE